MQLERQLRPTPRAGSGAATLPAADFEPPIPRTAPRSSSLARQQSFNAPHGRRFTKRWVTNAMATVSRGGTGTFGGSTSSPPPRQLARLRHRCAVGGARDESGEVEVETWDAIRSRRNVRSYSEEAIAPEDLDRILEAGRRTPSAGNQQAWDFVVCTDPEQLAQLAKVWRSGGHVARSAATVALIAPNAQDARSRDLVQYDLGQATMSIMLAAADRGIGSAHSAVSDQELARRLLGFPEDRFCAWLITLGVPADRPLIPIARPNRRPFEDVVHRGYW
jgi:nitroreductase